MNKRNFVYQEEACEYSRPSLLLVAKEILQESPCLAERLEERRLCSGGVVPPYKREANGDKPQEGVAFLRLD